MRPLLRITGFLLLALWGLAFSPYVVLTGSSAASNNVELLSRIRAVERYEEPSARLELQAEPLVMAIRAVESSGGKDCGRGDAGERTCFQIRPQTALELGCHESWLYDEAAAAACARSWLRRGAAFCFRWGDYAAGRWYNGGRCMRWNERPGHYELALVQAKMREEMR